MGIRGALVAAVLGTCLGLTACSGADEGPSAEGTGTSESAPSESSADESPSGGSSESATDPGVGDPEDPARARLQRFEAQAECLTEQGFTSTASSDGVQTSVTTDQTDAFEAASTLCQERVEAELGPDPAAAVLTEEQLGERYDELLDVQECLAEAGYPVTEPPTRESWVAASVVIQDVVGQAQPGEIHEIDLPWNPFDEVQSIEAMELCPIPEH